MSSLTRSKKKELYKTRVNSRSLKLDRPSKSHTDTTPIKDVKKIEKMLNYLKMEIAFNENKGVWNHYIAYRNYILVLVGLNIPLREEDILQLKAREFIKTRFETTENKTMKDQKRYLGDDIRKEILKYITVFDIQENEYLFQSRKQGESNNDLPLSRHQAWRIMKKIGEEIGINQTFGMHSLRKTYGYQYIKNAKNENTAILSLQSIYNHANPITTMRYVQWNNDDIENSFRNFKIGI